MSPLCHPPAWDTVPAVSPAMPRRSQQLRRKDAESLRWVVGLYELQNSTATSGQSGTDRGVVGTAASSLADRKPADVPASVSSQGWAAFGALAEQAYGSIADADDQFRPTLSASDLDKDPMAIDPSLTWERMAEIGNYDQRTSEFTRRFEPEA